MNDFILNNIAWFVGFGIGSILGVVVTIFYMVFTEDDEDTCPWCDSHDD